MSELEKLFEGFRKDTCWYVFQGHDCTCGLCEHINRLSKDLKKWAKSKAVKVVLCGKCKTRCRVEGLDSEHISIIIKAVPLEEFI